MIFVNIKSVEIAKGKRERERERERERGD